eukprot:Skav202136  [mRNA]  locus=scaffold3391:29879:30797:- [translate_table: standard]
MDRGSEVGTSRKEVGTSSRRHSSPRHGRKSSREKEKCEAPEEKTPVKMLPLFDKEQVAEFEKMEQSAPWNVWKSEHPPEEDPGSSEKPELLERRVQQALQEDREREMVFRRQAEAQKAEQEQMMQFFMEKQRAEAEEKAEAQKVMRMLAVENQRLKERLLALEDSMKGSSLKKKIPS